jgi:arylsulfatase
MTQAQEPFDGVIGRTFAESTPSFPTGPVAPAGAPNVVVVLLDDTGFAHLGSFGSDLPTPNMDRLAEGGLRYTNFHVTPLCSPTRAALLTGRNHHEVGMRGLANFDTGFPHQRGHIANEAATMAEVLRDEGYATFAAGKWHLCPMEHASAAGPYDQWPLQRGFDRFYGFLDGETDQFHPALVYDNHHVEPPTTPEDGYHLTEDLVDRSIGFIHDSVSIRPDRPFFLYLALGAMHAPHQAPQAYLDRHRGRYDEGWDVARQRWFDKQVAQGIVPADTTLAPRNDGVEAWDDLPEVQQRLAARLQEAFGAFLEHTDDQIGRLVDDLERLGVLDDTVIVLLSDNGASQEGGPFGVMHEMKYFNFLPESPEEAVEHLDDIGGPNSHTNYPWGWAQAGNTPYRWYKQNTHEGGVHVPLILHWPGGVPAEAAGGLRDQFHHVNDVAPTIYDLIGVEAPAVYRGVEQMPISGESFAYTIEAPEEPTRKPVQYFEMLGHRGLWLDGWKAVTRHQGGTSFDDDRWELYDLAADRSECHDLAADEPDRLAAMIDRWWDEAEANGVLPLDDRLIELFGSRFRDGSAHRPDRHYTYLPPVTPMPVQAAPALSGRSWQLTATIEQVGDGVIYATGTANSGFTLFVQDGRLVFDYNAFGDHHVVESTIPLPEGPCVLGVDFRKLGFGDLGRAGAEATLLVDGEPAGQVTAPFAMIIMSSVGPSIGYDHAGGVSPRYRAPFPFTGDLRQVDVQLHGAAPAPAPEPDVSHHDSPDEAAADGRSGLSRQ